MLTALTPIIRPLMLGKFVFALFAFTFFLSTMPDAVELYSPAEAFVSVASADQVPADTDDSYSPGTIHHGAHCSAHTSVMLQAAAVPLVVSKLAYLPSPADLISSIDIAPQLHPPRV